MDLDFRRTILGRGAVDIGRLIVEHFRLDVSPAEFMDCREKQMNRLLPQAALMPGAREVVAFARSFELPIAVATSVFRHEFDRKIARHRDFYGQFDEVITASNVSAAKPSPEIFLATMRALGIDDPASVLVLEDAPSGVKAANNAGMPVVMVPDPALDLKVALAEIDARPTQIAKSLKEIDWNQFALPEQKGGKERENL
jgi:pseudouridine-5'-monophosphatase